MDDVYNALNAVRAISPVAVGATGTGQTGKIIDRRGYIGPVLFNIGYPGLVEFPLQDVINSCGFAYFNSTAAYAVAYPSIHVEMR